MAASLRPAVLAVLLGFFFAPLAVADIVNGSSRDAVIAELGKPTSTAKLGDREILNYPKKVKIELENGVVVDIRGYTPSSTPAQTAAPAKEDAPPPAAAKPAPASTPTPAKKTPPKKSEVDDDAADAGNPAAAANKLGDKIEKMDTAWGSPPPMPMQKEKLSWLALSIALVLRFIYTVVALRLAFKYWEMDAFWTGTFAIAGIDVVLHGILEALGPVTMGLSTMSA